MKSYFPLFLSLENKNVVILGGGVVAERKVIGLLSMAAHIQVVSPEVTDLLKELARDKLITWIQDTFKPQYVQEAFYIISATNDHSVLLELKSSIRFNQLVTYADNMDESNAILPAVLRRGGLVIAISTSGASPTLAKRIKAHLEEEYSPDYEEYIEFLYHARKRIQREVDDLHLRKKLLAEIVDSSNYKQPDREQLLQERIKRLGKKE